MPSIPATGFLKSFDQRLLSEMLTGTTTFVFVFWWSVMHRRNNRGKMRVPLLLLLWLKLFANTTNTLNVIAIEKGICDRALPHSCCKAPKENQVHGCARVVTLNCLLARGGKLLLLLLFCLSNIIFKDPLNPQSKANPVICNSWAAVC